MSQPDAVTLEWEQELVGSWLNSCDSLQGWFEKILLDNGHRLPKWHGGKESACQCRRHRRFGFHLWVRNIPWSRKWQSTPISPGVGNGNPLQYSCWEKCMDRGTWWATAHGFAKSRTWLSTHECVRVWTTRVLADQTRLEFWSSTLGLFGEFALLIVF